MDNKTWFIRADDEQWVTIGWTTHTVNDEVISFPNPTVAYIQAIELGTTHQAHNFEVVGLTPSEAKTLYEGVPAVFWDRIITAQLAYNEGPYSNKSLNKDGGWWQRTLDQIDALTFHHTYGWNSPHALAEWYVTKEGGRPSTPYSVWITETGEILLCNPLEWGNWHDHTGHRNRHLSVGLAGRLHEYAPTDVQLDAAAKVAEWCIKSDTLPAIISIDHITGHMDWIKTECPGWASEKSGFWKPRLYRRIEALL